LYDVEKSLRFAGRNHAIRERLKFVDVVSPFERPGPKRVRISDRHLIFEPRAALELNFNTAAERFQGGIGFVVAPGPFGVLEGLNASPKPNGVRVAGALPCVAIDVMPAAVLKSDGKDIHDRMIEGLAAGVRIEFLRVS